MTVCVPWWLCAIVVLCFMFSVVVVVAKIRLQRRVDKLKFKLQSVLLLEGEDEVYELYRLVRELAKYECENYPGKGGCAQAGRTILDWCPPCQAVHVVAVLGMRRDAALRG